MQQGRAQGEQGLLYLKFTESAYLEVLSLSDACPKVLLEYSKHAQWLEPAMTRSPLPRQPHIIWTSH